MSSISTMTTQEYERFMFYLESLPREIDTPIDSLGNNCVWNLAISYDEIYKKLDEMNFFDSEVVSVGSGNGKLELEMFFDVEDRETADYILVPKMTCVDPEPFSHNRDNKLYFEPKYPYVSELIKSEPEMVDNCNLMLIWPSCNEEEGKYALEAIELLNPKMVVILYEVSGCAGTEDLRRFIYDVQKARNDKWSFSSLIEKEYDREHSNKDTLYLELVCLMRVDVSGRPELV
jgi:hypothetical protein